MADAVHDVAWSPKESTTFASVTGDGRVELWDLLADKNVPCAEYKAPPKEIIIEGDETENVSECFKILII